MPEKHTPDQETKRLRKEKSALRVQGKLLEKFVTLARSDARERVLAAILKKTVRISTQLTAAEKGSLFLLDARGAITDSILTRTDATPEQGARIIGTVFDKGLAGWVRQHRKVGLIIDTRSDKRWVNLANQPYIVRSALAVPISSGDKLLGVLTLLHPRPGHFSEETADLMMLTAGQIGSALENARLYSRLNESYRLLKSAKMKIERYSKALDAEMEKGKKIQRAFLPAQIPHINGWEISACFHPAKQVSGDFYDVFMLPGKLVGLVIADVCDKGIGSALFMALFRSFIRVFSGQINLHGMILSHNKMKGSFSTGDYQYLALHAVSMTNDYIAAEHGDEGMFATVFFGVLDPRNGIMTFINAGHEPLILFDNNGVKKSLKKTGPAVGMTSGSEYKAKRIKFEPGDVLIGYTDGVTEALSPQKEFFSKERLFSILKDSEPTATTVIEDLKCELFNHINDEPQFDDITILAVHRRS